MLLYFQTVTVTLVDRNIITTYNPRGCLQTCINVTAQLAAVLSMETFQWK